MKKENDSVQSIERAFSILNTISKSDNGMKLSEIVESSGLSKSTAYRILSALSQLGYIKKANMKYQLSIKLLELASGVLGKMDVATVSKPFLRKLCDITNETVHLVVEDETDIVYIHKEESTSSSLRMVSGIGMRRPLYCTAVGKSILAQKDDEEIEDIWQRSDIKQFTDSTIIDLEVLMREISEVRKNGFALDNEENEIGVRCIAVPIVSAGVCKNALSVSGPISRIDENRIKELLPILLKAGSDISKQLAILQ